MGAELLTEVLVAAVLVAVPFLLGKAFSWWKKHVATLDDKAYADAVEALEVGVNEAWENTGKAYKKAAIDGKLNKGQREELKDYAIEQAKAVAKEKGRAVLASMGKRAMALIVRKIVERRKQD